MIQAAIVILGIASIWALASKRHTRWGYLFGLISEPFWLYTSIKHGQWGIMILCVVFAVGWAAGLRNHWRQG